MPWTSTTPPKVHEFKVGDRIVDNDPRVPRRRLLTLTALQPNHVLAADILGRVYRIQVKRIYTDDKTRRTGYSLVR